MNAATLKHTLKGKMRGSHKEELRPQVLLPREVDRDRSVPVEPEEPPLGEEEAKALGLAMLRGEGGLSADPVIAYLRLYGCIEGALWLMERWVEILEQLEAGEGCNPEAFVRLLGNEPLEGTYDSQLNAILLACDAIEPNAGRVAWERCRDRAAAEGSRTAGSMRWRSIAKTPGDRGASLAFFLAIAEHEVQRLDDQVVELSPNPFEAWVEAFGPELDDIEDDRTSEPTPETTNEPNPTGIPRVMVSGESSPQVPVAQEFAETKEVRDVHATPGGGAEAGGESVTVHILAGASGSYGAGDGFPSFPAQRASECIPRGGVGQQIGSESADAPGSGWPARRPRALLAALADSARTKPTEEGHHGRDRREKPSRAPPS